jgi:hypothetical protein
MIVATQTWQWNLITTIYLMMTDWIQSITLTRRESSNDRRWCDSYPDWNQRHTWCNVLPREISVPLTSRNPPLLYFCRLPNNPCCNIGEFGKGVRNPQANALCKRMHQDVGNILCTLLHTNPPQGLPTRGQQLKTRYRWQLRTSSDFYDF